MLLPSHKLVIKQWVIADETAPKKQRHTSQRVYVRLKEAHGYTGSAVTVRNYFYSIRKACAKPRKVFIPQYYQLGEGAEVDWYETQAIIASIQQKVYIFQMRACYSGKEFHIAFLRQNKQCFLEAHVAAFNYFGGVFKILRNARTDVFFKSSDNARAEGVAAVPASFFHFMKAKKHMF